VRSDRAGQNVRVSCQGFWRVDRESPTALRVRKAKEVILLDGPESLYQVGSRSVSMRHPH